MKKGSRVSHTFEAVRLCRAHGVTPELSFVLGVRTIRREIEKTFELIRIEGRAPECEVILYFTADAAARSRQRTQHACHSGEIWSEGRRCQPPPENGPHSMDPLRLPSGRTVADAKSAAIADFSTVLGCRFPTVQDYRTPAWGKALLADWRAGGMKRTV